MTDIRIPDQGKGQPAVPVTVLVLRRYLIERRRSLRTELVEIERTLQEISEIQEDRENK